MRGRAAAPYPGVVLVIRADLVDAMVAHARRDHPNEACGVIVGPEGSGRPERLVPMVNAAAQPGYPGFPHPETDTLRFGDTFYTWESGADLRLYRALDAAGEEMVVIYHSHAFPGSRAVPSVIDVEIAQGHPDAHHRGAVVPDGGRGAGRGRCGRRRELHVRAHRRGRHPSRGLSPDRS